MGRPPKPIDPTESLTACYGWTAYAGLSAAFTILSFAEGPDVAFVQGPANTAQFIDRPDLVAGLMDTYDLIRGAALSETQTAWLTKEIRESL